MEQREFKIINWDEAVSFVLKGGILAYPTDTLWGLGCRADDQEICKSCLALKGEGRQSLASVVMTPDMLEKYARVPPDWRTWLPGPYTLVLPELNSTLSHLGCGEGTIGCRIPNHPRLQELVRAMGVPLVTTSLNSTGKEPAKSLRQARNTAESWRIGLIEEETGMVGASTVIKWDTKSWTILRPGVGVFPKRD